MQPVSSMPSHRACHPLPKLPRGFTLIELLVVIVIMGVILGMATLSMGVLGRDNEVEEQARRLYAVISQVREEGELQGRDIGVLVERDGYQFMRYQYATQSWQPMVDDDLLKYRAFPAGVQARMWVDDREIILKSHEQNRSKQRPSFSSSSSSSSSSPGPGLTDKTHSNPQVPQIALLSSGDLSPFRLRIEREGSAFGWRVVGKPDNTLDVEIDRDE